VWWSFATTPLWRMQRQLQNDRHVQLSVRIPREFSERAGEPIVLPLFVWSPAGYNLAVAILSGLLMTACALTDQTVKLPAHPPSDWSGVPVGVSIVVLPVIDQRDIRDHIGVKKNSFGMPTAKIYPDRNVAVWLRERLRAQLRATGFETVQKNELPSAAMVQVALLQLFVEPVLGWGKKEKFQTTLAVRVRIMPTIGTRAEREYLIQEVTAGHGPREKNYTPSLEQATAELMKRLIFDIRALTAHRPAGQPTALFAECR
jgi:uncharacterized lipoprotein YajG